MPYEYLKPINVFDEAAQRHDYAYYLAEATGIKGALFDNSDRVLEADIQLIEDAYSIMNAYDNKKIDPHTEQQISRGTYLDAKFAAKIFTKIVEFKLRNINR